MEECASNHHNFYDAINIEKNIIDVYELVCIKLSTIIQRYSSFGGFTLN